MIERPVLLSVRGTGFWAFRSDGQIAEATPWHHGLWLDEAGLLQKPASTRHSWKVTWAFDTADTRECPTATSSRGDRCAELSLAAIVVFIAG